VVVRTQATHEGYVNLMNVIADTPEPPYYAVIFTSIQTENLDGYAETAELMMRLASEQEGYLGFESAREGLGIAVSYWRDLESIKRWKAHVDHLAAQRHGRELWYSSYCTRIARVEREYGVA